MTAFPTWTPAARPGIIPLHPLPFGTILGRSFSSLRQNPRVLLGFALVVQTLGTLVAAVGRARLALQELFVGRALNLDQVRHLHGFGDAAERLTDPLLSSEGLRHFVPLSDTQERFPRVRSCCPCVHPRTPLRAPDAGSPCFARGAPSHGRRAAGHASERARVKSRLSDES